MASDALSCVKDAIALDTIENVKKEACKRCTRLK
jgi:hypothetical protein